MRFIKFALVCFVLCLISPADVIAQKRIANGDRITRGGNRLISVKSKPGEQLRQFKKEFGERIITLDARMSESDWQSAQAIAPFIGRNGGTEETTVKVLFDAKNIYLFWVVHEQGGIDAGIAEKDAVIVGDDYVQIDLKPWLGDDIKYARDYYYSIAVNPLGTVWDSYFDSYLDGYFFSSWDSNIQVATSRDGNRWFAEMIIPFSGLDHTSDAGRKWNLDFRHISKLTGGDTELYAPQVGVTVEQGIMVRRKPMVGYYWTRPEFMLEVKPARRPAGDDLAKAMKIDKPPVVDNKADSFWSKAATINIDRTDRMGERLTAKTARAKVAAADGYLCFSLEADGAKVTKEAVQADSDTGMGYQVAGINGVYVDKTLFSAECFWILLQPRRQKADIVHQPYYLVKVSSNGQVDGISYDRFGTPDRTWRPQALIDIYDTPVGWGAEVAVAVSSFDLPAGCDTSWGFNLFRNRLLPLKGSKLESELQAWLYTASDFLNPDTMGGLTDIVINGADAIRPCFDRKVAAMRQSYSGKDKQLAEKLSRQLDSVKLERLEDFCAAEQILEGVDNALGVADAKERYDTLPYSAKGGYALLDVQFVGDKGWAVGAMGTVLRSEDGGKSWQSVTIETDIDFYRVCFVNELEGWIAGGRIRMAESTTQMQHDERGGYGYIFHTVDGGKTWQCQYGERGRHIFGMYFIDEKTGFACGELGFLLKTEDGGASWNQLPTTNTRRWLYGIAFKDKLNGFAVGESETVIRTTDGGKTWVKINAPADRQFYGFRSFYRDISFNGSTGCIVGQNGVVLVSYDTGQSWQPEATFIEPKIREFLDYTSVYFATPKLGYIAGELGTRILLTEDGGKSWSFRTVENTDWLRAIWADTDGKVVVVGEREKVLVSDDRGFNWNTTRSDKPKADILILTAHGDDSPIRLGSFMVHYGINEGKKIVDIEVMRDAHSVEYLGEIYNLEHHRDIRMSGVRTTTYFDEFENGNNGCDYYHLTERLWEGEENIVRHIVAAIRAYRPDIVIAHGPVYGEYDKPGHKLSGRAGFKAFDTSGGPIDLWPQLTRLGLAPWQPKKLYCFDSESYPPTIATKPIAEIPLKGTEKTCWDYAEYAMCVFQSQGVHRVNDDELCLVKSFVPVPEKETSIFDGL